MAINANKLAAAVTKAEGGKQSVSIAQVKEVMKCTFKKLARFKASEVMALVERYK